MSRPSKTIINGSGISGLMCALVLARRGEGPNVLMVDKNPEPGGLLRRFNYDEWGDFDYGMHNMLETGIGPLDQLLFEMLPASEWQLLDDNKRDLAGIYFNGKLQRHTPYIDLRSLDAPDYQVCLADFLAHLNNGGLADVDTSRMTAHQFAATRFGEESALKTIVPSLEKIHKKSGDELDFMATIFTPMTRLAIGDETLVRELTYSDKLRERIAWSDQRTLPLERSSGRRAYYPIRYGMFRLVDGIVTELRNSGVEIWTSADVSGIAAESGRVKSVTIKRGDAEHVVDNVESLIWTTNIPLLGRQLGVDFKGLKNDKPLKTVIINLVVDRVPEAMGDLYYFFCYDEGFNTFRLTNFANYCEGAKRNGGYPIGMEFLVPDDMLQQDLAAIATEEYERLGMGAKSQVLFAKAEPLDSGFPMPTVNNIHALRSIRNSIRDMNLQNLQMVGILAEDNLFFQTDVLADAYQKLA